MFLSHIRDKIAVWLVKKMLALKRLVPIERARRIVAGGVGLFILLPLLILTTFIYLPFMIWDIFDIAGIDVLNIVHMVFALIYCSILVFILLQIKGLFDLLELIYHPIKAMKEGIAERLVSQLRPLLIKTDIIIGAISLITICIISYSIFRSGISALHIVLMLVVLSISALIIGLSILIYLAIRTLLVFLVEKVWRKLDDRLGINNRITELYEEAEQVIDVELN